MFRFAGFNAFGQFGNTEPTQRSFKEVKESDLFNDNDDITDNGNDINDLDEAAKNDISNKHAANDYDNLIIAPSWRYTAYANGTTFWFCGLLCGEQKDFNKVEARDAIVALAACDDYCLVLLKNGEVYKIESKFNARLEIIRFEESIIKQNVSSENCLEKHLQNPVAITHIACGVHIAVAISETKVVYNIPSILTKLEEQQEVVQLECGYDHAMILDQIGNIYTWGNGLRGQLGHENLEIVELPTLCNYLAGVKIIYIAAGGWHSAAISESGDLYIWGSNKNGQLGYGIRQLKWCHLPILHDDISCCLQDPSSDSETNSSDITFKGVITITTDTMSKANEGASLEPSTSLSSAPISCVENAACGEVFTANISTTCTSAFTKRATCRTKRACGDFANTGVSGDDASNKDIDFDATTGDYGFFPILREQMLFAMSQQKSDTPNCEPLRVFAGARHTVVEMSCGKLWGAGWSRHGQLGVDDDEYPYFDEFRLLKIQPDSCKKVVCGPWCTVIMK